MKVIFKIIKYIFKSYAIKSPNLINLKKIIIVPSLELFQSISFLCLFANRYSHFLL
jgi:hypothetical protein